MKKLILGISVFSLLILGLAFYSNVARANDDRRDNHGHDRDEHHSVNFNPDKQLSQASCGDHLGKPIIDVTQKVQNDADSGFGTPTYWAFDYFSRNIKVWPTTMIWNVTGAYTFDTKYLGNDYNYSVTLSQSGNTITGSLNDTYLPSVLTITNGSLSGNTITFSVDYGSGSSQGVRTFTGTIGSSGHMSGTWSETGSEQGHDTWSTTSGAANATNTYCAILTYDGNFYAVPGQGQPGDTTGALKINASVDQPINGDFSGGRRAIVIGTLLSAPVAGWPKFGNVTPVSNYQCDLTGTCPGYDALFSGPTGSWADKYFNVSSGPTDQWWGWQYKAGSHGTWVNQCGSDIPTNPACTGSSGNIQ